MSKAGVPYPRFCITRMQYRGAKSWWVRIQRLDARGNRTVHSKNFADGKLGGERVALDLAQRWRDQMLRKLPAKKLAGRSVDPGHGYVRQVDRKLATGGYSRCWVAWIRVERRRNKSTTRSIGLWGDAEARHQCEQWLARERRALRKRQRGAS